MASLSPLLICWFLLLLAWRTDGQRCPQADNIFPPSGTVEVVFTISGSNLQNVSAVMVGTIDGAEQTITENEFVGKNSTHLQFVLGAVRETGSVTVELVTARNPNCSNVTTTVDLRIRKICTFCLHL